MDLTTALNLFAKNVKGRIPIGYWEFDDRYVFNTKPVAAMANLMAPGQYVVTKDGKVYGTNPMQSKLDMSKMKKLPTLGKKR